MLQFELNKGIKSQFRESVFKAIYNALAPEYVKMTI